MVNLKKEILFLILCLLSLASLKAQDELHILQLLPNLCSPLAVEPAIPKDFVARSPSGTIHPYDWIYWGPENVLSDYFKDPSSLNRALIRVKLSANVAQIGPNSFSNESDNPEALSCKTTWGNYPVRAMKTKMDEKMLYMAWVGLNDPEAGWTLLFNLVYPEGENDATMEELTLWQNLITKSRGLKDGDFFKACGQDLQEGYTIVTLNGVKIKMIAEKRRSDQMMQVRVIPENLDMGFHYEDMFECRMGAKWKHGEAMVKVSGEFIDKRDPCSTSVIGYVTSIFFTVVDDFSKEKEDTLTFQRVCHQL